MTEEHHITLIETFSEDKNYIQMKFLYANDEPKMILHEKTPKMVARELCNIHGLWEGNND